MEEEELEGRKSPILDAVPRKDSAWGDDYLMDYQAKPGVVFERLVCQECGQHHFEVLITGSYETSARCCNCGMYYIVHSG